MSFRIIVPFKTRAQLTGEAENFLQKYHPHNTYPIPIEEIIEFQLGLDIIPLPGLHKFFDIDGFLSADRAGISIDENVYQARPGRYRFTLAHEIGHFVLHRELYGQSDFRNVGDWKRFIESFPEREYSLFEWQAYEFAGHVLVPAHHLEKRIAYHRKQIRSMRIENEEIVMDRVTELLAQDFVVSREVIHRRIINQIKYGS